MREAKGAAEVKRKSEDNAAQPAAGTSFDKNLEKVQLPAQVENSVKSSRTLMNPGEGPSNTRRPENNAQKAVRINFSLTPAAASRLQHLATSKDNPLSRLGVLSVRVGDAKTVHTTNGPITEPPTKKRKTPVDVANKTTDSPKQFSGLLDLLSSLAAMREGSSSASTSKPSGHPDIPANLQPNVVATGSEPIPVTAIPGIPHPAPAGPFPFSSMTKVASSVKSSSSAPNSSITSSVPSTPSLASSSTSTTTSRSNLTSSPEIPPPAQNSPINKALNRNIALNSPLLVNLLQGSELESTPVSATPKPRARNPRKKKEAVSEQEFTAPNKPAKPPRAPRKKKPKLTEELTNGGLPNGSSIPGVPVTSSSFFTVFALPGSGISRPNVAVPVTGTNPAQMATRLLSPGTIGAHLNNMRFSVATGKNPPRPPGPPPDNASEKHINGENSGICSGEVLRRPSPVGPPLVRQPSPAVLTNIPLTQTSKAPPNSLIFAYPSMVRPNNSHPVSILKPIGSPTTNGPTNSIDIGLAATPSPPQRPPSEPTFKQPDVPKEPASQMKKSPSPAEFSPRLVSVPSPSHVQKFAIEPQQ